MPIGPPSALAALDPPAAPRDLPPPPARPAWERLVDAFVAPAPLFRDVAARPVAWPAIAAASACELARVLVAYAPSRTPLALAATALLQTVVVVVPAAALAAALRVALLACPSATIDRVFAVVAHAALPYHLLRLVVAAVPAALGVAPAAGGAPYAPDLAWLGAPDAGHVASHLLRAADVGRLWQLALVAVGLSAIVPTMTRRRAAAVVAGVWGAYLLVTTVVKLAVA